MHDPARADHARHDLSLIAGHAAGDLSNLETATAAALLATCTHCAEVHHDLVAIASATRALPPATRAPRDFRLTAEQADLLRRGSWLRALLRPFASAGSATRPMARAFTSIGLAGLFVAVVLPGMLGGLGGAALAPAPAGPGSIYEGAGPGEASQAPAYAPAAGAPTDHRMLNYDSAQASLAVVVANGDTTTSDPGGRDSDVKPGADVESFPADSGPPNLLLLGSAALFGLGLALFALRLAARRVR